MRASLMAVGVAFWVSAACAHGVQPAPASNPEPEPGAEQPAPAVRVTQSVAERAAAMARVDELSASESPQAVDELIAMLRDARQSVALHDRATGVLIDKARSAVFSEERARADEALFAVAADAERSERARQWAARHLVDRWVDDAQHAHGQQLVAWMELPADSAEPEGAQRLATGAVRHVLSRRPDKLESLRDHTNPRIAELARAEAARWRRLDPKMTFIEMSAAVQRREVLERFARQAVELGADRLRRSYSRQKQDFDRALGNDPASLREEVAELRRKLTELQRLPLIGIVATSIEELDEAREEIAAGEERARERVAKEARGRPATRLSLSWMFSSVFMTESGRMESSSSEEGFSITLPGRPPRELTPEEVERLSRPDEDHFRAQLRAERAEGWLAQFSEETRSRAAELVRQARIDAVLEAQRKREREKR